VVRVVVVDVLVVLVLVFLVAVVLVFLVAVDLFFVVVVRVVAVVGDVVVVVVVGVVAVVGDDVVVVVVVVVDGVVVVLVVVRGRWWQGTVETGGSEPMAPSVVLFTSVGIGKCQQLNSLTLSATTVTTRSGGGDTSHFTVGVLRLEVKKK
jgi:hypothetical protein